MNRLAGKFAILLILGWLLRLGFAGCPLWADESATETKRPLQESLAGPIKFVNEDGKLTAIPGIRLEDFLRMMNKEQGGAMAMSPPSTLDKLSIAGKLVGARIDADVTMQARVTGTGWSSIPLRLGKLVLAEPPQYEVGTEQILKWENDGYVWWVKGSEKPPTLKFKAYASASVVGDETRWGISLPRANACTVTLAVPEKSLQGAVRSGEGIVTVNETKDTSEVQVVGAAGEFQLGWRQVAAQAVAPVALLESSGEILVKIEGRSRISSEARLKIRSFGGPMQAMRVRLPPGMELLPFSTSGYATNIIEDLPRGANTSPQTLAKASQLVEVKLDRPASGVVEIRLDAVLVPDEKRTAPLEPARFEIIGAVRQRGTMDAIVDGDWTLQWTEDPSVRRLDTGTDLLSGTRVAAKYEYFRQPCGLKMQVAARPTRVHVEPLYIVHVEKERLRLEGTLKYRIRGAKATSLALELGDWTPTSVGPDSQVEADPAAVSQGVLPIQVVQAGGLTGNLEIKFEAQRPLPKAMEQINFTLPRPKADIITPGTLVVVPADNMELAPLAEGMQGLAVDALPANLARPTRQQPPLVFRDLGGAEPARFAAAVHLQFRRTRVSSLGNIRVGRTTVEVEQRLHYNVQYEPQTEFDWWVPHALSEGTTFQALDGVAGDGSEVQTLEPLEVVRLPDEDQTRPGFARYRAKPATSVLGSRTFIVRYSLEVPTTLGITRPVVSAPFVLPVIDATLAADPIRLSVTQGDDLQVEPVAGVAALRWERVGGREFRGILPAEEPALNLRITPLERSRAPGTSVQRVFLQTWLNGNEREDRVAIRLISAESKVRLRLPENVNTDELLVAVDGEQQDDVGITDREEVVVEIPADKRGKECVLEVWYAFVPGKNQRTNWGTQLKPPAVVGVSAVRQIMWHVVTPADEHLLLDPNNYVPELNWVWRFPLYGRHAAQSQEELETWVGATKQDPLPAAANHYLFSSFGHSPPLQLSLMRRRWLLLFTAGMVLCVGMVLLYLPASRHPAALMVAGVTVASLAFIAPELAGLAGQGAFVGVLLMMMTGGLRRWLVGVPTPPPVVERPRRVQTEPSVSERPSSPGSRPPLSTTAAPALASSELHP